MAAADSALMGWLRRWVMDGVPTVVAFQRACGVDRQRGATNPVLHWLFKVFASFGDEVFYITFLPWLFWEVDMQVARRLLALWVSSMYSGQLLKELLRLPRPDPARVTVLESHYTMEFGMPSTHAMTALAMPWYIVHCSALPGPDGSGTTRFSGNWRRVLAAATAWTVLTTLSRLYMGVHTPADLLVGLALGGIALAVNMAWGAQLDDALLTSPYTPFIALALCAAAVVAYPRPRNPRWVSSPGDTTIIIGVATGVAIGCWLRADVHLAANGRHFSGPESFAVFIASLPRVAVGLLVLVAVRFAAKYSAQAVFLRLFGPAYASKEDAEEGSGMHSVKAQVKAKAAASALIEDDDASDAARASSLNSSRLTAHKDGGLRSRRPVLDLPSPTLASSPSASSLASSVTYGDSQSGGSSRSVGGDSVHSPHRSLHATTTLSPSPAAGAEMVLLPPKQRYEIELPTKAVTYTAVGIAALYAVPRLMVSAGWPMATDAAAAAATR